MDYKDFHAIVKKSSRRLLRLYMCAVADKLKPDGRVKTMTKAISFGESMAGRYDWETAREITRLGNRLKNVIDTGYDYNRRIAREVALLCIEQELNTSMLEAVANGVRAIKGMNFDREILTCLKPDLPRTFERSRNRDIFAMAQKSYNEKDWHTLVVLADALEEAQLYNQDVYEHLRQPCHWRGCYILDQILGI